MTVPVIGFNPTGRRQDNRPRGAIGGGFGGGSIPSTKSSNVQVSGLLLNLLDRYQNAQDRADRVRKYNSAKTWFANHLFDLEIMSFDEAARIFDADPKAAIEKFNVGPALLQLQGKENFDILRALQGLGGKTPDQATSQTPTPTPNQPPTPTSGQTQTPPQQLAVSPDSSSVDPIGEYSGEYSVSPEGVVQIPLKKGWAGPPEPPAQTQTLPSTPTPTPTSTQQPQPKTLSNLLQDFLKLGTPTTGPHAQPVSPEDEALLDKYLEREEEVVQELIREDEERNDGRPVSPEKEEEIRNFVEGAVARQEDYIEKKDNAFFKQQAQKKKLREARSAAALLQASDTNPLAALMRQKIGVGEGGSLGLDPQVEKTLKLQPKGVNAEVFNAATNGELPLTSITMENLPNLIKTATFKVQAKELALKTAEFNAKELRKLENPLGKEAVNFTFNDGTHPSPGTSLQDLLDGKRDFIVTDAQMRKDIQAVKGTVANLERMRELAGEIFFDGPKRNALIRGSISKGYRSVQKFAQGFRQMLTSDNPDLAEYIRLREGLLSLTARGTAHQLGNLAEQEQIRTKILLYSPFSLDKRENILKGFDGLIEQTQTRLPVGITQATEAQKREREEELKKQSDADLQSQFDAIDGD